MQTTTNLFTSKVKESATSKKTDKKIFKSETLGDKISRLNELKAKIDALTGELKMIEGDVKQTGKTLFLSEYKANKRTPESFKIADEVGSSALFIVADKYTSVDENKAEILRQYDLLNENVTYKFNGELVEKYGQVLSEMICGCGLISEEDKGNLISGEKTYSVQKGAIDRLIQYDNMEEVFELINPICSLKK
jgi:hypothetical protein